MPVAVTTLRATLAAALANAGVWSTFSFPPPVILANSVIVVPADLYLEPQNNSRSTINCMAHFKILIVVPYLDNQGNLSNIEDFMVSVFTLLAASTLVYNIGSFSGPTMLDAPSGQMLTTEITCSILTTWS